MYDTESIVANEKNINGFLKPQTMPVDKKKRYPRKLLDRGSSRRAPFY